MPFDFPPHMLIPIIGIVCGTGMTALLLYPLVSAWARRMEHRGQPQVSPDVANRLARIEAAVESIAVEVERISESQRFLAKLEAERGLPSGGTPNRPR